MKYKKFSKENVWQLPLMFQQVKMRHFWNCSNNDNWLWKLRVFDIFLEEQWPSGSDTDFPIQGSHIQNNCVAPNSTRSFIHLRSIKWVPGISENIVVKIKFLPRSGSVALRQLDHIVYKKGLFATGMIWRS